MITITVDDPEVITLTDSNGIRYRAYSSMVHVDMDGIGAYLPAQTDRKLVELQPRAHIGCVSQTIEILLDAIYEKVTA